MVDIHCHLLPFVDDGAASFDESCNMAEIALDNGFTDIIVTPHANRFHNRRNYYDDKFEDNIDALRFELKLRQLNINIYPGMEVMSDENLPSLIDKGQIIGLNHSKYVLIEFLPDDKSGWIKQVLQYLISSGYIPIIAHPERYYVLQDSISQAGKWVEMGCLLQINKESVLPGYIGKERDVALSLLDRRLAHFIATDAHGDTHRNGHVFEDKTFLDTRYGREYTDLLFIKNAHKVLNNQNILVDMNF
ncbi:MAG: hypothetical protein Q4B04_06040 [bacterium]|nr:hypothetical protein [bacterium]